MAKISEVYLSTLSAIMTPYGMERYFVPLVHICAHSGRVTQSELGSALKRDKVSAMRIVNDLCKKGLVVRKRDFRDRRCQILEATQKAYALLPKLELAIEETNDILLQDFSEKERQQFIKAMSKLNERINQLPEPRYIVKAFKRTDR